MIVRVSLLLLLVTSSAFHASAQGRPSTPDAVGLAFLDALARYDYAAAAEWVHPEALARMQADLAAMADAAPGPDLAVWTTGAPSGEAVLSASPAEAFGRHLTRLREVAPSIGDSYAGYDPRVVESVVVSDTAYVVMAVQRMEFGTALDDADALRLIRGGAGWRVLLPARIRALSETLADRAREGGRE